MCELGFFLLACRAQQLYKVMSLLRFSASVYSPTESVMVFESLKIITFGIKEVLHIQIIKLKINDGDKDLKSARFVVTKMWRISSSHDLKISAFYFTTTHKTFDLFEGLCWRNDNEPPMFRINGLQISIHILSLLYLQPSTALFFIMVQWPSNTKLCLSSWRYYTSLLYMWVLWNFDTALDVTVKLYVIHKRKQNWILNMTAMLNSHNPQH